MENVDIQGEQRFPMKYKIQAQFGSFTNNEIARSGEDWGGANALLLGILVKGSKTMSSSFTLIDGENNGAHSPQRLAEAWLMLTRHIAENDKASPVIQGLAKKAQALISEEFGE